MLIVRAEPVDSPDAVALLRAAFFVLRADGEAVGCLGLHPTGELTRLSVAPRLRRSGGARALLAAAEEHARHAGLARLFLDTRQDHWFEKALLAP